LLCCVAVAAGVVPVPEGAEAWLRNALAAALEANRQFAEAAEELRRDYARACEENARLREENAAQAAELEELRAGLAVLQRMVFGRSSEKSGPETPGRDDAGGGGAGRDHENGAGKKRGPGARAGRRDYSHLPRSG
jgi:transposase